eukprot:m.508642 g.508642  ORF g.508642 m.508642 type:complete len:485 (-) comp21883_c0_seq4:2216-3670(-)
MMSGSEDIADLKKSMSDVLWEKGILGKLQAELRASVFLALEDNGYDTSGDGRMQPPKTHPQLTKFADTDIGRLVIDLVRDFLRCFELEFTDNVLVPEARVDPQRTVPSQEDLARVIGLPPASALGDGHRPILAELLQSWTRSRIQTSTTTATVAPRAGMPEELMKTPNHAVQSGTPNTTKSSAKSVTHAPTGNPDDPLVGPRGVSARLGDVSDSFSALSMGGNIAKQRGGGHDGSDSFSALSIEGDRAAMRGRGNANDSFNALSMGGGIKTQLGRGDVDDSFSALPLGSDRTMVRSSSGDMDDSFSALPGATGGRTVTTGRGGGGGMRGEDLIPFSDLRSPHPDRFERRRDVPRHGMAHSSTSNTHRTPMELERETNWSPTLGENNSYSNGDVAIDFEDDGSYGYTPPGSQGDSFASDESGTAEDVTIPSTSMAEDIVSEVPSVSEGSDRRLFANEEDEDLTSDHSIVSGSSRIDFDFVEDVRP